MSKKDFISQLKVKLNRLSKNDLDKVIDFYEEMIDDMIEDGFTEEEAIKKIGNIDDIARDIQLNLPITTLIENKIKESKSKFKEKFHNNFNNKLLWILIIILTSPIWFIAGTIAISVIFSLIVSVLAIVGSILFAIATIGISVILALILGIYYSFKAGIWYGLFFVGFSITLCGLFIIFTKLFKELFIITKNVCIKLKKWIKSLLIPKENKDEK